MNSERVLDGAEGFSPRLIAPSNQARSYNKVFRAFLERFELAENGNAAIAEIERIHGPHVLHVNIGQTLSIGIEKLVGEILLETQFARLEDKFALEVAV